jgi:CheY-like chemotaxis protein
MTYTNVLFVDDEKTLLDSIRRSLRGLLQDCQLHFASGGDEALAVLSRQHIDVIVSDMWMPGMDGAQLLTRVKESHPRIYRILLTGRPDEQAILGTMGIVDQFLTKPCAPETLRTILQRKMRADASGTPVRLQVRRGTVPGEDCAAAASGLAAAIRQEATAIHLIMFPPGIDSGLLAARLEEKLDGPVLGWSTPEHVNDGAGAGNVSGLSLASAELSVLPYLIDPISGAGPDLDETIADITLRRSLTELPAFGLLLSAGDRGDFSELLRALQNKLPDLPMTGGLLHGGANQARLILDGTSFRDAAVLVLFLTTLPFRLFKHQPFLTSTRRHSGTISSHDGRLLLLDGEPAAQIYARTIGVAVDRLDTAVFRHYPLILHANGRIHALRVTAVGDDFSLSCACPLPENAVLGIGKRVPPLKKLNEDLQRIRQGMGPPRVILGCNCLEESIALDNSKTDAIARLLIENKVFAGRFTAGLYDLQQIEDSFSGIALAG